VLIEFASKLTEFAPVLTGCLPVRSGAAQRSAAQRSAVGGIRSMFLCSQRQLLCLRYIFC